LCAEVYPGEGHPNDCPVKQRFISASNEIERLRRAIVYAACEVVCDHTIVGGRFRHFIRPISDEWEQDETVRYDGTDAGLVEAVFKAMKEE
jgi:hypothetical protein